MPLIQELARNLGMLASEAAGQRSRAAGTVGMTDRYLPPGTLMQGVFDVGSGAVAHTVATTPAAITSILLYGVDATEADTAGVFLVRDCEVNDAYLVLGTMDLAAVTNRLAQLGIIVRTGVLTAPGATFATPRLTDPALAESLYGPKGLDVIPITGGASSLSGGDGGGADRIVSEDRGEQAPPSPPDAPSQPPQRTDTPPTPRPPGGERP